MMRRLLSAARGLLRDTYYVFAGIYSAFMLAGRERPTYVPHERGTIIPPLPPCLICLACGEDIPTESQERAVCQRCRDFMREEWREADTERTIRIVRGPWVDE